LASREFSLRWSLARPLIAGVKNPDHAERAARTGVLERRQHETRVLA
jgi:hypothetical protein